jgi:DNA-directed RNA polymerase specialized sigma subunit
MAKRIYYNNKMNPSYLFLLQKRSRKRLSRPEPEYGQEHETYEKIRERVLQERAVTNAIDALQERWRMIMYIYYDLLDLNEDRRSRKLKKLCVQRQFEFILVVAAFVLICLPISIIFINQIK